jgi:outer membrane beta-barrel protein
LNLSIHTFTLLLLLAPVGAFGQTQEEPGIDLSEPPPARPGEQRAKPPPRGAAREAKERKAREEAPLAPGESDVALGDRVKAVQRKGFLKRHRFEIGLDLPGTLNDAFYEKVGVGGKLAYNFEDSFALAVRGAYYWQLRSPHVREGQVAFSSQLLTSQIHGQAMLDGVWSPVYGKVAWLGQQIVHFDMYLLAGLGGVWSATSLAPRNEGPHPAADAGAGIRFYPRSWLALDAGFIATLYPDQPVTSAPSTLQKVFAAHVGFAVFFPTSFEYVYP